MEHVAVMLEMALRIKDDNPALELMKADFTGLMEADELLKRMARGRAEFEPAEILRLIRRCAVFNGEDRCGSCPLHDDSYCVDTLVSVIADMIGATDGEKAAAAADE